MSDRENVVIKVENLTKDYGHKRGVFNISFDIKKGEFFGFLGPNGSGKTTTIRHLLGFSKPQEGATYINGLNSWESPHEILENLGYIPGEIALPEGLTGWQFLNMICNMKNVKNKDFLHFLLEKFNLDPRGLIKRMSLGVKRKLAVVSAFVSDPEVLILDEPTSGLDAVMQEKFVNFLMEEKARGKTILLSSHIFSEVDQTCDRVAIIKQGEIATIVETKEIKHNKNKTFEVGLYNKKDFNRLKKSPFNVIYTDEGILKIKISVHDENINKLIEELNSYNVKYIKENKFTLQDYFMHFYKEKNMSEDVYVTN